MNSQESIELEMKEPLSITIVKPVSTKKNHVYLWFQRIFNIDDVPNQKHYHPVFIMIMCILHICIYLLKYIDVKWNDQKLDVSLYHLCKFFIPCMRPTPHYIRVHIVKCEPSMINVTCYYDDVLKNMCFSFMYPYQFWRFLTVNLVHVDLLHLLPNLVYQCLYGITLERKYGSICIIVIYWLSNLSANLTFMLTNRKGRKQALCNECNLLNFKMT